MSGSQERTASPLLTGLGGGFARVTSPGALTVVFGLATVWMASYLKLLQFGMAGPVRWLTVVVVAGVAMGGIWSLVLVVSRRNLSWPLVILLVLWGWVFLRNFVEGRMELRHLLEGQEAFSLLIGGALVVIAVAQAGRTSSDPGIWHLAFPVGFVAVGFVFTALQPSLAFRVENAGSDYLVVTPWGQYMGIAPHPNALGMVVALGLIILLGQNRLTVPLTILGGVLAVILIASGSDGAFVAVVGSVIVMFFFRDLTDRPARAVPWRSLVAGGVTLIGLVWTVILIGSSGLEGYTTGRVTIWTSFIEPSLSAGWWGYSFHPDYSNSDIFGKTAATFQDPHNTWLSLLLTAGYPAVILHALFWVATGLAIVKMSAGPRRTIALGLSVFLLTQGLVESQIIQDFRMVYPAFAALLALLTPTKGRTTPPLLTPTAKG